MDLRPNSSFRPYITSTISLFIIGWGCAALAIFTLTPTVWARWLLFFGGSLGLTGLALPVTWFLNLRFPSNPPAGRLSDCATGHLGWRVRSLADLAPAGAPGYFVDRSRPGCWSDCHRISHPHARKCPLATRPFTATPTRNNLPLITTNRKNEPARTSLG